MSYNIDTIRIKKIKDFQIPLKALSKFDTNLNPHDEIINFAYCETVLTGTVNNQTVIVTDIPCYGEGSGNAMAMLEEAFKQSTGEFIASTVWEGGDSICRIEVKDGNVKWTDIEI